MSTNRPRKLTENNPASGKEPSLSENHPISTASPVTGNEPTLSGDEGLLHALEMTLHENPHIRFNAVSALERFRDINTLDRLLNMLADPDKNLRNRAAWALIRFGDVAVPGLVEIVRSSKNEWAREEAAWALTQMELPSLVPKLVALLEDGKSEGLEGFIIQGICQASTDNALAYLLRYLQQHRQELTQQEFVQSESITNLSNILAAFQKAHYMSAGPVLLDILTEASNLYSQSRIIRTLAALNYQPACNTLLQIAWNDTYEAREAALWGLYKLQGDVFIPQLIQMFTDGDPGLRCRVMSILAEINAPQAAELIRTHFCSDDTSIQRLAIHLAGEIKDVQSVPSLIELLSADTSVQVRNLAVHSLGAIGDERAILPLRNLLDSLEMVWLGLAEEERDGEPWVQAKDCIIPALQSIGTLQAKQIVKEWEARNPESPFAYWSWYV